jgi:hypothetical protein
MNKKTHIQVEIALIKRLILKRKIYRKNPNFINLRHCLKIFGSLNQEKIQTEDMVFKLQKSLMK